MIIVLSLVFLFSGISALIFEFLWFHLAGLVFGNSVWAASIVLASFMGGLAIGNGLTAFWGHKIKKLVKFYAMLEVVIAVSGFSLVLLFPHLTKILVPLYRLFIFEGLPINFIRSLFAFLLMLIPTIAMGATLPILVKALNEKINNFGRALGLLYGWNTFGAVLGVLLTEIILIKCFGLVVSGLIAACFNLLAGAIAIGVGRKLEGSKNTPIKSSKPKIEVRLSSKAKRLLLVGFFTGFVLLALEVIWFRFLMLLNHAFSLHFAFILASVLLGIGAGGIATSFWYKHKANAHENFVPLLFINGTLIVFLYNIFISLIYEWSMLHVNDGTYSSLLNVLVLHSLFLTFPVSFVSGIIFTMLGKMLHGELGSETKTTGLLTLFNTLGGMGGSLFAGLIFIPFLGVEKSLFLLVVIYGLLTMLVYDRKLIFLFKEKRMLHRSMAWLFLVSVIMFPFGLMNKVHNYVIAPVSSLGEKRIALKEGLNETIQYLQRNLFNKSHYHRLVTNSYPMSATDLNSRRYMKMYVYWPVAVHPHLRKAALISYGVGNTAKALTDTTALERIDIIDISKDIIDMSRIVYPRKEDNPTFDPRVHVHIEDGRFFLLTTNQKYDLITAEPPPPHHRGVVNLYSQEYFELIYKRLAPQGIVTYWLPVRQLSLAATKSILKGFCQVFEHCSLWDGGKFNWMMVGVKQPAKPVTQKQFARQWLDPVVGKEMRMVGFENPEMFGSLFMADNKKLMTWLKDSLPLVDNYPKRLGEYFERDQIKYEEYRDFVTDPRNRDIFLNSEDISMIWPRSLVSKSLPYFSLSQEVATVVPLTTFSFIRLLHKYITDPTSSNYNVYMIMDSDAYAHNITQEFLLDHQKTPSDWLDNIPSLMEKASGKDSIDDVRYLVQDSWHIAVSKIIDKEYSLAEKYFEVLGRNSSNEEKRKFYYLRMYLLSLISEKQKASSVKQEYLQLVNSGKLEKDEYLEEYWKWLVKTIPEFRTEIVVEK